MHRSCPLVRIWTPSRASECVPHPEPKEGTHSSIRTTGEKAQHSVYSVVKTIDLTQKLLVCRTVKKVINLSLHRMVQFGNVNIAPSLKSSRPAIFFCSVCVQDARIKISLTSDKNYLFGALSKILLNRCQSIWRVLYTYNLFLIYTVYIHPFPLSHRGRINRAAIFVCLC